jgi:hypothetical protein
MGVGGGVPVSASATEQAFCSNSFQKESGFLQTPSFFSINFQISIYTTPFRINKTKIQSHPSPT